MRKCFIDTAKTYFGVPYHPKYWPNEDDPYHNAPLYLDCSGLVRQVVKDLRYKFGFELALWNQSYQYDTLPIDIEFEELKPGDLIFYSGTYYNTEIAP